MKPKPFATEARLSVRPCAIKSARAWCANFHRRLPRNNDALWAIVAVRGTPPQPVGVAIVGRPCRMWDDGRRLQVHRVAVLEGDAAPSGNKGACSILYGACARAARGMGASDLITYTNLDEPGTTMRASGWIYDGLTDDEAEWSRPSRPRPRALFAGSKQRWLAPWSVMAAGHDGRATPRAKAQRRAALAGQGGEARA